MKIDLDYEGLRFVLDTDAYKIDVYKPMKKIDSFEVTRRPIKYARFREQCQRYMDLVYKPNMI